jgi:hypothetical protein
MTAPRITLEELHRALGGEIRPGKEVRCPGPGHSAGDRSLSVRPADTKDGFVTHSFAADAPQDCNEYVRTKLQANGLNRPRNPQFRRKRRELKHCYLYLDETGQLLFQVVRYEPKGFAQRRPDSGGGWIWNLKNVRRVLYRLPELIEALSLGKSVCSSLRAKRMLTPYGRLGLQQRATLKALASGRRSSLRFFGISRTQRRLSFLTTMNRAELTRSRSAPPCYGQA